MLANVYQSRTAQTAMYRRSNLEIAQKIDLHDGVVLLNLSYTALGLASEAGEVSSLVKKLMRDEGGNFRSVPFQNKMAIELGDCMWYISEIATILGFDLEQIMIENIEKLRARQVDGTLQGSGDER